MRSYDANCKQMVTEEVSPSPHLSDVAVSGSPRIAVVIASVGRPEALAQWRERISSQSRAPDVFVYSVTGEIDLPPEAERVPGAIVVVGAKGLPKQRNAGIEAVVDRCDVIAFFDDDYLPSRGAVEGIERLFREHPEIISANGTLLADGINTAGVTHGDAMTLLDSWDAHGRDGYSLIEHQGGLYGCNMVYRTDAVRDVRFDEVLPLYGWQEDVDFGARLLGRGRTVITDAFVGVHQGSKGARTPGVKLGYSQVANPFYLVDKGTMSRLYAIKIVAKNMIANHVKSVRPEPWVDRIGRVRGNWIGVVDLLRGRAHPQRIFDIR